MATKNRVMAFQRRIERDDDLILFRELQKQKRDSERNSSLLRPVSSDDYEDYDDSDGKYSLYRIPSGKKETGYEILADSQKNDYDWLKTPPATPLFPSLEMEPGDPTAPQLIVQRELPIIQPLTRTDDMKVNFQTQFAGSDSEASKPKTSECKANHTNSSKSKPPTRSITPSHNRQKPSIVKNKTNIEQESAGTLSTNKSSTNGKLHLASTANNAKTTIRKQNSDADSLNLNLKKSMEANDSQKKLKSRGISPIVRSSVVAQIAEEFSDKAPPNLRTDNRSISATRGRISNPTSATLVGIRNRDQTPKASSRQSRSPSPSCMSNGRSQLEGIQKQWRNQKERSVVAGSNNESRAHVMGSKMVEKVMNARKSATNQSERDHHTKVKPLKHVV